MPLMECGEGGYKWGESGKCFIGPGAKEKALAVGKAIKVKDEGFLITDSVPFKATIDKTTGFLTAPVVLARTGIQYYMGYELGLEDRLMDKIGINRPAEEVFHPDSVASYTNLVVTDDHPSEIINLDNVKNLQMGTVSNVKEDNGLLTGLLTITDKDLISKVKKGKREVSVGYQNNLKSVSDEEYEFVQTQIRANHLAIVDAGRCGSACKLTLDHNKGEKIMIVTIDGIKYDVKDEQLAQAIMNRQSAHDEEVKELEKKVKETDEEKEEAMKEKEKAKATADSLKSSKLSDEKINELVSKRAELITEAKMILGDKMPDCVNCDKEIKTLVVEHVTPDMDLKDKSDAYLDAAYDMAIKQSKKAKESVDNLNKDLKNVLKDKDGNEITRDSARNEYLKNMGYATETETV